VTNQASYRVVLAPPERWAPERESFVPNSRPNHFKIYDLMRDQGIEFELLDPSLLAARSVGRRHPIYSGLDPIRALKILAGRRRVDMILSVFESSAVWPLALRQALNFAPKVAMWDIIPDHVWPIRRALQRWSFPRADQIFVLTEFHNAYLAEKYGRSGRFIGQHVDTDFYRPTSGRSGGPILAIGEDAGRDFETLLEAVSDLDVDLVLKTKRNIRVPSGAKVRIKQIKDRVTFQELRQLYETAQIVVVPLRQTLNASGIGSMLEASAMAKPIVVSDNKAIADYFVDGSTALVAPVGDKSELRDRIRRLLANPAYGASLGDAARTFIHARFSYEPFAQRMATAIIDTIKGNRTQSNPS
jgi:glycosyltransferase involved in cell wall biosynthesis